MHSPGVRVGGLLRTNATNRVKFHLSWSKGLGEDADMHTLLLDLYKGAYVYETRSTKERLKRFRDSEQRLSSQVQSTTRGGKVTFCSLKNESF